MELVRAAALVFATLTTGLIAGLFYSYACSVMLALGRTEDRVFIDVMQRINSAIQNGWFALSFVGSVLFTALALVLHIGAGQTTRLVLIVAGLVLYLVAFGITVRGNIPLNVQLDAAGAADRVGDPAAVRARFERPWVRLHLVRTLFSIGAFGALCAASVI
ncbi:anthrone oxygenase family protein [Dactylosporangium sp. NPDC000555]|uniref:anthrone oxygenase family protein n=1 Tax=Dactylosporangium sp. NPDC000555 TaxID=3154260 RepID=UPI00331F3D5A